MTLAFHCTALDKVWRFWSLSEGLCAFAFEAFAPAAWSWATQHTHCRHFVLLHRSWKTWPKMIKDHQRWHHLRELRDLSMILGTILGPGEELAAEGKTTSRRPKNWEVKATKMSKRRGQTSNLKRVYESACSTLTLTHSECKSQWESGS